METPNQKKARLLGEPYGTATSKLRKMLLFDFAKRLNLLNCYRCSKPILNIQEFTIDHKKFWYKVSIDLFYDLNRFFSNDILFIIFGGIILSLIILFFYLYIRKRK